MSGSDEGLTVDAVAEPSLASVRAAARTLSGIANRTPVFTSRSLDERAGASVFLKCENFQRTGSFKFRGAYNAVAGLGESGRRQGVITYSSGNHAQAVALVGRLLRVKVTVVMPATAPLAKRDATEAYGATVVQYDPKTESREVVAARLTEELGGALVPPFDHPDIVSGQGTAGLELLEEVGSLDLVVAPCGGGGLLSGTSLAATSVPGCSVIGVEPELAADAVETYRTGRLHTVTNPPTIADGLRTPSLGGVTWPIIRDHVSDMMTVSEADILEAMRFLWTRMKLVAEPSGAVALAAILRHPEIAAGKRAGVLVSGGNVDLTAACALLA